jgi:tRNA (guanine-N7-)-methyltransferase
MIESEFGVPIPGEILPPEGWVKTAIKRLPPPGPLDWAAIFGRTAPVVLELGCGNGRFTLASALRRPEVDHLATDLLPVVIRYATRRADQRGLSNTRFAVRDALSFVRDYVGDGGAAEIHLYHPQPYHDPREAHKRLVTPGFLAEVHRALAPGGLFVVQTDHPDYWAYMAKVLPAFFGLTPHPEPWPDAPEGRTRREILARQRGLPIYRGVALRRDDIDREAARAAAARLPRPTFRSHGPGRALDAIEGRLRDDDRPRRR